MALNPSKPAFGIDLGTTNSVIGYYNNGKPDILASSKTGDRTVPSYVCYGQALPIVGQKAQKQIERYPKQVAYDAKRMIGLDYSHSAIQQNKEFWIFDVVEGENNRPVYDLGDGRKLLPEEVSSEVLKELKKIALKKLGFEENECLQAVISVPDYFNQGQKQGTLQAAKLAGIDVLNLITEPNAAAFAYGYDHQRFDGYNIFVFDMGGGTTDVSILKVKEGKFEVVGRAGDNQLGGRDIDNLLLEYYAKKIKSTYGLDISKSNNLKIKVRLREMCEKVKQDLSDSTEETNAVKESSLQIGDINEVLLIGGSSRVKEIREMLEELFINQRLNESVNPDEAVAYGATIRAAQILNDKAFPHVLIEKLPIGIGTDLSEDRYDIVLERNTLIPSEEVKKNYVTTFNNQKSISFYIYEGERPIASKNTLLGKFSIKVPPKDVGEVKVILTMSIDKNGILKVYAEYEGNKEELIIDSGKISSGNKIKEMLKEMKMYEEMDRVEVLAKTARSSMRNNIEHIKAVCEKETGANIKRLMNTVKEIDGWLSSTSEPLTREIKQKFISIEDEAEKLVKKYNKKFEQKEKKFQIVVVVPDIADQNCRKALLTAAESSRQINKNKKIEDILKVLEKDKFEPKTTRVLNRTNAIAIAYLRKLVEDTRKIPFDRKIPKLDLFVYCVDINNCYSARFETKHGVVRQTKFKDYSVSECNKSIQKLISGNSVSEKLAAHIFKKFFKDPLIPEEVEIIFAINEYAFRSNDRNTFSSANWRSFDDGISLLKHKVFDYLPKLPSLNCLSLLGADTKSRMLCGDIDYIDYDVPPVSLHKATLTLNDIEVSLVDNCEQLPIERTILESERKINVEIKYDPPINGAEVYEKKDITEYRVIVSSSGIFVDIGRA